MGQSFGRLVVRCYIVRLWLAKNEVSVEQLRFQMLNQDLDGIYTDTSDVMKKAMSKDDFVERIRTSTEDMRAIDETFTWDSVPEKRINRFWNPFDSLAMKELRKKGKVDWIQVQWNDGFKLCGFAFGEEDSSVGTNSFRHCD